MRHEIVKAILPAVASMAAWWLSRWAQEKYPPQQVIRRLRGKRH